ncbi:MAG: ThiF family adenylyltransferase [Candidatus Omnitrophica bacterium]|nr:ThiF family adenylyltransferase [Candidatus Omnitrophota bacterium]
MSYTVSFREVQSEPTIVVVGVGGTGSLVADGVCRLFAKTETKIMLIDYDRVEEHNLLRQNFYPGDVGKFKSQVIAERLARFYGRPIGYSVFPYEKDLLNENYGAGFIKQAINLIVLGCTDQAESRRHIAESITWQNCWIDAGNGYQSGQVLIGNTVEKDHLKESFSISEHRVIRLPAPSLQLPALLIPPAKPETPRDCAEAIDDNSQSPVINQAMATLMLDVLWKLITDKLTYMGIYLDLEAGTLQYVPATPMTIARMFSMKESELFQNKCALGARYHL